ncbi:MAG: ComEC/Rec2 family competence protein [Treponema sp.]|jgi:competence protein ComEC|nr:ComEC/Rec2 family competence protein [Treponema sp.]
MVSPLVIAALAAALVFYLPPPPLVWFLILGALAAGFVLVRGTGIPRTLRRVFGFPDPLVPPPLFFAALCLGMVIGFLPGPGTRAFAPGLPVERIGAIRGRLLDDPRILSSGFAGPRRAASPAAALEEERGMASVRLEEAAAALPGASSVRASARGRALVYFPAGTMPRVKEFGRGAEIYVEGGFLPEDASTGGSAAGRGFRFKAVSVHTVKTAPALERFRTALRGGLLKRLGGKSWGGLAAALLLGTRENLDDGLSLSFRDAGLSHILALSGMHLAFLSALLALALKGPLGKKGAVLGGLAFIILYVFLVGPQPSLVRAAIMYVLGSVLVLSGTIRQPLALLGLSFLIQLLWDPPSALGLSFILSYLALGGLLLLSGPLEVLLRGMMPPLLSGGLSAALGAFIATAPVAAACFGVLRPVGVAAGLIAAPLSGLFMTLSLAALGCGNIPLLGFLLDRALSFLLFILGGTVSFFSRAPGLKTSLPVLCAALPLIAALVFFLAERRRRYRSYLAPFA